MENCKLGAVAVEKRQTLIQAFERLDQKCVQLRDVARLTEILNEKLNRTEGYPKCDEDMVNKVTEPERNIVELFNLIADKMEEQINVIGDNTERSMKMID